MPASEININETHDLTNFEGLVVGPLTSGTDISGSGNQVQPRPVKRGRGRPCLVKADPNPPK